MRGITPLLASRVRRRVVVDIRFDEDCSIARAAKGANQRRRKLGMKGPGPGTPRRQSGAGNWNESALTKHRIPEIKAPNTGNVQVPNSGQIWGKKASGCVYEGFGRALVARWSRKHRMVVLKCRVSERIASKEPGTGAAGCRFRTTPARCAFIHRIKRWVW
jgi:hypothetical protein